MISFISPCMLPLLPVYISYFGGGSGEKRHTLVRAVAFVLGFTAVFSLLGLFAGTVGAFLNRYRTAVNIVCGAVVILFGLSYLEVIRLPFFKGIRTETRITGVFSAFIFGVIYSVSLTPCVGAFLGAALMMASASGTSLAGLSLLLVYSLGLGLPFLLSALLLDKLNGVFRHIKTHYRVWNTACGIFLIAVGILMAAGLLQAAMTAFI